MHDSFEGSSILNNALDNDDILAKLKEQIENHSGRNLTVDIEALRAIYRKFDRERTKEDYDLLERFLRRNPVFTALRAQVDMSCIYDLLKCLELQKRKAGDIVYRYG